MESSAFPTPPDDCSRAVESTKQMQSSPGSIPWILVVAGLGQSLLEIEILRLSLSFLRFSSFVGDGVDGKGRIETRAY